MSVNDESAAKRQFVASSGAVESRVKQLSIFATVWVAAFIALFFVVHGVMAIAVAALLVLVGVGWGAFEWRRWRQRIVIDATPDGVTVNLRKDTVFPLADAQLGVWAMMGVALHLQSGSARFVLGGRDRRISPQTRLDASPVQQVDAWLWASDFDELVPAASGEPTRCLLFANPELAAEVSSFAIRKHIELRRSLWQPQLAVDVSDDGVRVIHPAGNTLRASASLSQVTAAPVTFRTDSGSETPTFASTTTGLIVRVPGLESLRIGCRDVIRLDRRFWWHGDVPVDDGCATYVVSGGDWLALVDRFGLTGHLGRRDQST